MIEKIYSIVENRYFSSSNFNGMPIDGLANIFDIHSEDFIFSIRQAIKDEVLTACFDENIHIRKFSKIPKDIILEGFDNANYPSCICLYPHEKKLSSSDKLAEYSNRPYELELAKGAGQLEFRTFESLILEEYRNGSRYSYRCNSIDGQICITDRYYESDDFPEGDKVFLETFGFAYDDDRKRYVAVFLKYLKQLPHAHQKIWEAKEIKGNMKLHPDYYRIKILGLHSTRNPILREFIEELKIINEMCVLIGKPKLFLESDHEKIPKDFDFLLQPTNAYFDNFILLLDKMMSDNINKKFFKNSIDLKSEEKRNDGKIIVTTKGSIQMLEEWVNEFSKAVDPKPIENMIGTFKKIRKLRQSPAHEVNPDSFKENLFEKQRGIIIDAYDAVLTLRQILENDPKVREKPPKMSEQLFNGELWSI